LTIDNEAAALSHRHDWAYTGPQEIAPGVTRIPLALPDPALRAVNVYAIVDGDALVLIDSGWAGEGTTTELTAALRSVGFSYADVRDVLVTHVHQDHYSEAMTIRRLAQARISLGEGERPNLDLLLTGSSDGKFGYFDYLKSLGADQVVNDLEAAGYEPVGFAGANWEYPDNWLADSATVSLGDRELAVVATPGHTRGHVVFVDHANSLLFAGDHVLPHITPSIGLQPANTSLPLGDYLNSLDLMLQLPDMSLLPAHGMPTSSVHLRVRELLEHHLLRLDASAEIVVGRATSVTADEVARELPWTSRLRPFADLATTHQMLAVAETAAHLDVLVTRATLTKSKSGGRWQYAAPPRSS
jgi:glyoxylase-like metal-dependent hydrolase (beta-lactamase superfamily II)